MFNIQSTFMRFFLLLMALASLSFTYQIIGQPSPNYNITASQELARFAGIAFCGKHCVQSWTCGSGKGIPVVDVLYMEHPITKAAGYVGYNTRSNQIVLSFRGSSNAQNWIQDANFQKVAYFRCPKCQIHTGFYVDYLFFDKDFTDKVKSLLAKYPTASILGTGHSLGAAISAITAIEMKANFPNQKVYIHNFGQPRIGNIYLANYMSDKLDGIFRVVHNRDLVPHLPPQLPGFQYHHPPYEVFFNSDLSVYKVCNDSGEDSSCSNKFFPAYDPNDHDHYFIYISQVQC